MCLHVNMFWWWNIDATSWSLDSSIDSWSYPVLHLWQNSISSTYMNNHEYAYFDLLLNKLPLPWPVCSLVQARHWSHRWRSCHPALPASRCGHQGQAAGRTVMPSWMMSALCILHDLYRIFQIDYIKQMYTYTSHIYQNTSCNYMCTNICMYVCMYVCMYMPYTDVP